MCQCINSPGFKYESCHSQSFHKLPALQSLKTHENPNNGRAGNWAYGLLAPAPSFKSQRVLPRSRNQKVIRKAFAHFFYFYF